MSSLELLIEQLRNQIEIMNKLNDKYPSDYAKGQLAALELAIRLAEILKGMKDESESV